MTIDYQVRLIKFPSKKVRETVIENEDGSYTIFIEASLTKERQQEAFNHAITHIFGDDFTKDKADEIEFDAHSPAMPEQSVQKKAFYYDKSIGLIGLVHAYQHRCSTKHEAAEFLGVTEKFLSEAIECYKDKYGCCATIDNYIIYFEPYIAIMELYI